MTSLSVGIAAFGAVVGNSGGTGIYARNLVEALADFEPSLALKVIVNEADGGQWGNRTWPSKVEILPIRLARPLPLTERAQRYLLRRLGVSVGVYDKAAQVARQIDRMGLSVIHYPATTIYPLTLNIPTVLTFFDLQHEYYPEFFTKQELAVRAGTYGVSVERAAHIIVPTEFTKRTLVEKYRVPPTKMTLIPGGIGAAFHPQCQEETERIRQKYGLPERFLFYPANPWQHKNHARLMAALRILRDQFGEAPRLALSGRLLNEQRDSMSLAIAAGVQDLVTDLGFVPTEDLPGLHSAATAMVFPSLFEGFGIPLVEAMACGCPIVAADATTIPEITNGAALLFDPMSPEDMARAMWTLWQDSELAAELAAKGFAQLHRFDWRTIVSGLMAVYQRFM